MELLHTTSLLEAIIAAYVPEQLHGEQNDIPYSITLPTTTEARNRYLLARQRLRMVNRWHEYCGILSASFQLTDEAGNKAGGMAVPGQYIAIDLPGPGPTVGEGYDWVYIEKTVDQWISDSQAFYLMQVRPSHQPGKDEKPAAHFFEPTATSSFVMALDEYTVTAAVLGRNEIPNQQAINHFDKFRNSIVGHTGASGLSQLQWKSLVHGVLELS